MSADFKDNSAAVKAQMEKNIKKALVSIGLHWQTRATELARDNKAVDTGRYRASLSFITPDKESGRNKTELKVGKNGRLPKSEPEDALIGTAPENTVIVGSNVEYAHYIEEGTKRMSKRPIVGNAILNYMNEYEKLTEKALNEGFK